ncbi:hypothetical protein QTP70_000648 [Hemibagrus guttatus]|uniref:Uncharacterized protein n=1 Tax=Hemibagrus guttatus TaxID=175788 RepID=A0AAE0QDH8_9TELE|nr:hypothetical protein QTP70_000648 [Hemibagrus guttatus]
MQHSVSQRFCNLPKQGSRLGMKSGQNKPTALNRLSGCTFQADSTVNIISDRFLASERADKEGKRDWRRVCGVCNLSAHTEIGLNRNRVRKSPIFDLAGKPEQAHVLTRSQGLGKRDIRVARRSSARLGRERLGASRLDSSTGKKKPVSRRNRTPRAGPESKRAERSGLAQPLYPTCGWETRLTRSTKERTRFPQTLASVLLYGCTESPLNYKDTAGALVAQ